VYNNRGTHKTLPSNLLQQHNLTLYPDDVFIKIDFALPSFTSKRQNHYAVWLEGVDTAWHYLGKNHFFEFNKPPAGRYKLRLKAAPAQGFWEDGHIEMDVVVKQAFYQAVWFQVAMPLAFIALAYALLIFYVKRVKRKQEEQTRINKRFAELELQALQSQMNPHFVFNALGAIQYFIQNNDTSAADSYLAKFAKLMRLFLESSKNRYIPLSEEIKLLSLYIELEQMRFKGKFQAHIEVDEDLDTHDKELPSILVQPFVENAINHGLFHKESEGRLTIRFFEKANGTLVCIIEDNGVGREKAAQLKHGNAKTHKSRGMQIVDERLEVLKLVDTLNIAVRIEDLRDEAGAACGTRIVIEVPPLD
jgi:two-component sensor histidine kinase